MPSQKPEIREENSMKNYLFKLTFLSSTSWYVCNQDCHNTAVHWREQPLKAKAHENCWWEEQDPRPLQFCSYVMNNTTTAFRLEGVWMLWWINFGLYCNYSDLQRWSPLYTKLERRLYHLLTINTTEFHVPFESYEGSSRSSMSSAEYGQWVWWGTRNTVSLDLEIATFNFVQLRWNCEAKNKKCKSPGTNHCHLLLLHR